MTWLPQKKHQSGQCPDQGSQCSEGSALIRSQGSQGGALIRAVRAVRAIRALP